MFVYSKVHSWQNNPAVRQILVFPNIGIFHSFEVEMEKRMKDTIDSKGDINDISDSNIGAIYKLRAVKDSAGKYIPILRCGITGHLLWEGTTLFNSYSTALDFVLIYLFGEITSTINPQRHKITMSASN